MHAKALLGRWGEEQAVQHWQSLGAEVLARNWWCQRGEIDLVLLDGGELVACEVKTRRSHGAGTPFEAITTAKLLRLVSLFGLWRVKHPTLANGRTWRIDAIAVTAWPDRLDVQHLRRLGF